MKQLPKFLRVSAQYISEWIGKIRPANPLTNIFPATGAIDTKIRTRILVQDEGRPLRDVYATNSSGVRPIQKGEKAPCD